MKKLIMLLLTYGLTQPLFAQKTITQKLDELLNAYCSVDKFNGSVLVAQKGHILLEKGYGIQNETRKNDANSIFQIYSITKTVTSTVILQLAEQGKLSLSDKLSKYYPEFPMGDSISIAQLLTHTSGIYDYTHGNNMADQTEQSFIKFIEKKPLDFSPGTAFSYSNSGYWLLGFIIQKITGMRYEDAVKKFVFDPLKMTHSGFDFKNLNNPHRTTGYEMLGDDTKKEAIIYDPPGPFAAGAIYSTVGDMYKFHKSLQAFTILSEQSEKQAFTPFKNNYGYGWMINSYSGKKTVAHSGGAAGYRSNFLRIPEEDICIVLLDNTENANMDIITNNILNVLFDQPYKIPSEIHVDQQVLEKYTGYYALSPFFSLHITLEGKRLAAQATGQGKTVLLAQQQDYFYAEEANGFAKFTADSAGQYNTLILHQGGKDMPAKRFTPTWGLIGSATSKGWNTNTLDIPFTEDATSKGTWKIDSIQLKKGQLKFRFNNDWNINYGGNNESIILEEYGENIKVEAGTYDILLDLRDRTKPVYRITRK